MVLKLIVAKPNAVQWPIGAYTVESIDKNFDAVFANFRIIAVEWDATVGIQSYGANDSGGTGYRLVRVPNA